MVFDSVQQFAGCERFDQILLRSQDLGGRTWEAALAYHAQERDIPKAERANGRLQRLVRVLLVLRKMVNDQVEVCVPEHSFAPLCIVGVTKAVSGLLQDFRDPKSTDRIVIDQENNLHLVLVLAFWAMGARFDIQLLA